MLIIAVPCAIMLLKWINRIYGRSIIYNTSTLFVIGFLSMFISGNLTGFLLGNAAIDIQLHDTYYVVAHFQLILVVALLFGVFAVAYNWYPKIFGRFMNETWGKIHFWGTTIGTIFIFWPMYYIGMAGVPRRYYSFEKSDAFSFFTEINKLITIAAGLTFIIQLIFVVNFLYSIRKGKKLNN
jgi:cytochrome c oxidase subunit I